MSASRERPIIFSAPMVKALLAGTKTQTRRVMNPQPPRFVQHTPDRHPLKHPAPYIDSDCSEPRTEANPRGMSATWCWWTRDDRQGEEVGRCPYGVPGDRLWVRETWRNAADTDIPPLSEIGLGVGSIVYRADEEWNEGAGWRSPIFMPREHCRLTLAVVAIRVQRLQEITEEDARAEGMPGEAGDWHVAKTAFAEGWDSINGKRAPWKSDPWVWVVTFRRAA